VTKATFYKHYGSKDKLIITYIAGRHESMSAATLQLVEAAASPQDALHEIVAQLTATIRGDGFRGCVFSNAAAEFPDPAHPVRAIVTKHRDWQSELISSLLSEIGHPMAGDAADEFVLAIDGAHVGGYAGDPIAATTAFERTTDRVIGEAIHA
jgi:AcrR family transcriptional regulator